MTRYAFIGNCQIQALFNLYRQHVEPTQDDVFRYIRSYEDIAEADRSYIAASDVVVEQVQDFKPKGDIAGIQTVGRRIFVPVVNAGFLWPYAGQPHPLNAGVWYLEGGPYGSEASDAFLNRMINRKVAPDEAVARYRDTDVNKTMNLDRLLELSLEKQRARDAMTGFSIADVIEAHFRDEPIFRTPYHPNARVAKALATQFFVQMGVSGADIARMQNAMLITPFPKEELPLHPSVIRHFNLRYANADTRYAFLSEGRYTFEEYANRYMRYDWNAALQEGIALARAGDIDKALERVREGLAASPKAAPGYAALGHLLQRKGDHDEAIAAMRHSLALDPDNAVVHSGLAGIYNHVSRRDEAEAALREAMARDPWEAHFPTLLSHWLRAWKRIDDALACATRAIEIAPYAPAGHVELGCAYDLKGDSARAELCWRKAVALAPQNVGALTTLASLLSRQSQWDEAASLWQNVVDLEPANGHARGHLVHALQKSGKLATAIALIEEALAKTPRDVDLLSRYAAYLAQDNRPTDALVVLRTATLVDPTNRHLIQDLAQLYRDTGDLAGAESALRQLAAADPTSPVAMTQLAHLLAWQRRWPEARVAAEHALTLGGSAGDLHGLLATVHQETGDVDGAAAALTRAAALAPANGDLQYRLSKSWEKLGRLADAVTAARAAVAIDPGNPHWQTNLGHMLGASGDLDGAEAALREAVAASPTSAGFHAALADLLLRRGRHAEAVAASRLAVSVAPDNAHFQGRLQYMLEQEQQASLRPASVARAPVAIAPTDVAPALPAATARALVAEARRFHLDGDHEAARNLLLLAVAEAPEDGDAHYNLSQVLKALDKPDAALEAARLAVKLQSDNPHWLNHLGVLLMQSGAVDEAEDHLSRAVTHAPQGAGFQDSLAQLLARQGRIEEAIQAVHIAVSLEPRNIHFLEHLSRLLESAGDTAGAVAALEQAHQVVPDNSHFRTLLARMRAKVTLPQTQSVLA